MKTWFVTGASRGLGRALSAAVISSGDQIVATARDARSLAELVARAPERVLTLALDVNDGEAATSAAETAISHFGGVDVVVNNAGYGNVSPIENTSLEEFRRQIETNLFGTIIVTKAFLPHFRQRRRGHFLQVSSIGGRRGAIGRGPYSAAKFGVEGFSEVLAAEVGPLGISVTIVEPGGFRTDFAGSSASIEAGDAAYADTVGQVATMQRAYSGRQPGDPARAAAAMLQIAMAPKPPLRLPLGSDAFEISQQVEMTRLAELSAWESLSKSTDYEQVR